MKKLLLGIMVLVAGATAAKAQFFVGGGLGFWASPKNYTSFWIEPDAGYSFNDHWAVGLAVGFDFSKESGLKGGNTFFYAAPYARFKYFSAEKVNLFLDGVVGVSLAHYTNGGNDVGFQIIIRPGIAVNLTDHFSLVGTFGALGYRKGYRGTAEGFGLTLTNSLGFGFYYSF